MRSRPPKKTLTRQQEHAADAFIEAAEAPDSGSGREAPRSSTPSARTTEGKPWEAPYVRADVTKGYALRLPEPLYLKLKWMAEQTGKSMNTVIRDAVETEVEAFVRT